MVRHRERAVQVRVLPIVSTLPKVDVLLEGPDKPFFQNAFCSFGKSAKSSITPPDLEEMTRFSVANFSRGPRRIQLLQASSFTTITTLHVPYVLRGCEHRRTRLSESPHSLARSVQNQLYGSLSVAKTPLSGGADDGVATSATRPGTPAYEPRTDAAVYYYRKVPTDSPKLPTAFYESVWTYSPKAIMDGPGTFQVLHSPYFSHYFIRNSGILRYGLPEHVPQNTRSSDKPVQCSSRGALCHSGSQRSCRTPMDYECTKGS